MSNESEEVVEDVDVVEEVNDNDNDNEADSTKESDGETTQERTPETPEAKRARLKRQLEQLDKKHGFKDEAPAQSTDTQDERYDRLELKTEGVTAKKEQDAVIEYARFKKVSVVDALNSPAMKAELKEMRSKSATPSPSTRTNGGSTDDVSYWASQAQKGKLAPTAELRSKVRAHLAGK